MKILECKLLSFEEADKVDKELRKTDRSWWLRSPGASDDRAMFVYGASGFVSDIGYFVSEKFGVRPGLYLESYEGKSFELAGHNWINVFDNVYLCEDFVGISAFNNSPKESNDYEESDINKYLKNWAKLIVKFSEMQETTDYDLLHDSCAETMAELLTDEHWSTYKMFETLLNDYLSGNDDVKRGIDYATQSMTGYSMESITEKILEKIEEKRDDYKQADVELDDE